MHACKYDMSHPQQGPFGGKIELNVAVKVTAPLTGLYSNELRIGVGHKRTIAQVHPVV